MRFWPLANPVYILRPLKEKVSPWESWRTCVILGASMVVEVFGEIFVAWPRAGSSEKSVTCSSRKSCRRGDPHWTSTSRRCLCIECTSRMKELLPQVQVVMITRPMTTADGFSTSLRAGGERLHSLKARRRPEKILHSIRLVAIPFSCAHFQRRSPAVSFNFPL